MAIDRFVLEGEALRRPGVLGAFESAPPDSGQKKENEGSPRGLL
jgi:hypothetical protein